MKNRTFYSIVASAGVIAVALPSIASDNIAGTFREPYVSDVGAAPRQCSDQITFDQLPPPVQATVRAQRGTDVITKIDTETKHGQTVYCIQFQKHADQPRPELVVAPDGKIVKERGMAKGFGAPDVAVAPDNR